MPFKFTCIDCGEERTARARNCERCVGCQRKHRIKERAKWERQLKTREREVEQAKAAALIVVPPKPKPALKAVPRGAWVCAVDLGKRRIHVVRGKDNQDKRRDQFRGYGQ